MEGSYRVCQQKDIAIKKYVGDHIGRGGNECLLVGLRERKVLSLGPVEGDEAAALLRQLDLGAAAGKGRGTRVDLQGGGGELFM